MKKREKKESAQNISGYEFSARDNLDETLNDQAFYDAAACEEYPDLQFAAVSEGAQKTSEPDTSSAKAK